MATAQDAPMRPTLLERFLDWVYPPLARLFLPKQRTFCYCPTCKNELCSDSGECYDVGDGTIKYMCSSCGTESRWLFDAPVPIYLDCIPNLQGENTKWRKSKQV